MSQGPQKSTKILVGRAEIATFAGFGVNSFPELIAIGLPAVFYLGKWRAHAENIERWIQTTTIPAQAQRYVEEEE